MMNRNKIVEIIAEAICDEHGYRDAYGCANCAVDRLEKAGFLNFNLAPGASAETALSANTRLGEVPAPLVEDQAIKEVAGGLGETPAVRQNEQTQTVLPHQLVLIKGKKDWFCWFCKKYEHELIGKTGGCARRAGL